jgi:hypothetical protein
LVVLAVGAAARGEELAPPPADDPPPAVTACPECVPDGAPKCAAPLPDPRAAWGVAGFRGVYAGQRMAPNGVPFDPVFSLDLDFNLWLWRAQGLYLFADSRFWGQHAQDGITNQKADFSKREYDLDFGGAWNYAGLLEFRVFAYSLNNLNRGLTPGAPWGFKDGVGIENRLYLSPMYLYLGTDRYDVTRADFVSLGYLPSKSLVGGDGEDFNPSVFARAYLTHNLWPDLAYAYLDVAVIAQQPLSLKLLNTDAGVALRPLACQRRLEFRAGCETPVDLQDHTARPLGYLSVRFVY